MHFSENEFRDYLYENYEDSFHTLIVGKRDPLKWNVKRFPPLKVLLQQIVETRINEIIDGLDSMVLNAKELRLEKFGDTTTRIDLLGKSENNGLVIIELKKSKQTERQAFTELLAYSNHFCSIFPGLSEHAITTILVSPMNTRTVKDAYVQELLGNNKLTLALIPVEHDGEIKLAVFYPDQSYYQWFENNLLDDRSMYTVAIAFQEVKGWIDLDNNNNQQIEPYSKDALNTISNVISHRLEAEGFHSIVYATQSWGEFGKQFPHPNVIYAVFINPFSFFRTSLNESDVIGESQDGRLAEVQSIYNQLAGVDEFWLEMLESDFHGLAIRIVEEEFDNCFLNVENKKLSREISLPAWQSIKASMINSVFTHNLDTFQTGLIRRFYTSYIKYIYQNQYDDLFYFDGLPKYSYDTFRKFLPVWEILKGIGLGAISEND